MWEKLVQAWKIREVRNSMLFVFAMMVLFRFLANVPLPGVDVVALQRFFESNQVLGLVNLFSGGTLENFSVIALGVAPYITASIIFQLLGMIIPQLDELQKEGERGRQRINQWTRMATVPLAALQSIALISLMQNAQLPILTKSGMLYNLTIVMTVTAGTMFLMWIGELISEKKVGNGISLLIFAGIVAGIPSVLQRALVTYDSSQLVTWIGYGLIAIVTVLGVVYISEAQRNIPIQYARQVRGAAAGTSTHLPLRVLMAGVIPIIFAISLLLFPTIIGQFFLRARTQWLADAANWIIRTLQNEWVYGILYFALVVGFTYFYTAVIFKPDQVAENLQKQGGFIPGIRPGNPTETYLQHVVTRITLAGSVVLGFIAVMPFVLQSYSGTSTFAIGGTSLLIVVSVVIESMKQIESHVTMREYDVY
ncbi:preprotein translocase subunit SecY [Patescibacteria group bacterium]|uniref:Protein translocase subunit SecY n=1 Tax=candidate division WWE3 bacterium TaxID=2053526 RepID=A0A928TQ67_UNCKA|nr:preprotein translocase subunit SecY [candidate division WWE3 bacterium]MCL4732772.1 preprotein translocase subunit SecY [Patescibacteria group bacterium]MDL1952910.1 preprotein translocase subunit SecY [Candidatus Uhrbacteria bacterium UHB]RIL00630.1 MAG: preprotein translocase subunit SecY [Candidatus Uhrbacteria bacterium]